MNISPWVQLLVRNGVSCLDAFPDLLFTNQANGYGVQVKSNEWIGYRELNSISTGEAGIRIVTARAYLIGTRESSYAWDELNAWNYEKGIAGYYISCSQFEVSCLNAQTCMSWYNYCVLRCCIAYVATGRGFPSLCKGVNIGFLDSAERELFDSNGFPAWEMERAVSEFYRSF